MKGFRKAVTIYLLGFASAIFIGILAYVINPYLFIVAISCVFLYLFITGYSLLLHKAKEKLNHTWYITFLCGFLSLLIGTMFGAGVKSSKVMLFPALFFYLIFMAVVLYHIYQFVKNDIVKFVVRMRDMYDNTR